MDFTKFYGSHLLQDDVARKAGFNPYYPVIESALGDPVMINGKEYINLASNNYLGLANDPRMILAAVEGAREYGVSMCATPIAAGYSGIYKKAEKAVSEFLGMEEVLLFPSCYQANNGLFQAIAGTGDLILVDRSAHSSLVEGIRTAGCRYRPYRHNDTIHLQQILDRSREYRQVFVVTESVFSTEGTIAPFREIYDLCRFYEAVPVVDDSHGIGVIGRSGKGILEYAGISDYQGIYTASAGKALATSGGIIAGKKSLMEYLRYSVSHLIYSTAMMPAALQALIRATEILAEESQEILARLWNYTRLLSGGLKRAGFELTDSESPIVSICSGNSAETLRLSKKIFSRGILATPFISPSVPENEGRIRMITGANLRPESIDRAIGIFSQIMKMPV